MIMKYNSHKEAQDTQKQNRSGLCDFSECNCFSIVWPTKGLRK